MSKNLVNVRIHTGFRSCNYACDYCIAGHGVVTTDEFGDPVAEDPSWDESRLRSILENLYKQPFRLNVRLQVPGEIFLNKRLIRIAQEMTHAENIHSVNLLTNLSLREHQYQRLLSGFDPKRLAMVASHHPGEIVDLDHWMASAVWCDRHYDLAVVLVAYPPLLDTLLDTHGMLRARGLSVFVQPYIGDFEGKCYPEAYSDEERKLIRKVIYSRHDLEFQLNLRKPGLCNAGYRSFYVTEEGLVLRCGSRGVEELGNLAHSPALKLWDGPRACPKVRCQCDTDNMNTVLFSHHYALTGINQHKYRYRFQEHAKTQPELGEYAIPYTDESLSELPAHPASGE